MLLVCVADPTALGSVSSGGTAVSAMLSRSIWWMFVMPQQPDSAVAWTNRVALTMVTGSAAAGPTAVISKKMGKNQERIAMHASSELSGRAFARSGGHACKL